MSESAPPRATGEIHVVHTATGTRGVIVGPAGVFVRWNNGSGITECVPRVDLHAAPPRQAEGHR